MIKLVRKDGQELNLAYASKGSAGVDLTADEDCIIAPGKRVIVKTGLFLKDTKLEKIGIAVDVDTEDGISPDYLFAIPELQIRSRSGLAAKHGVMVLNGLGTIDQDYPGEIGVILANFGDNPFEIRKGDRIAQAVLALALTMEGIPVKGARTGGFGSSGK